MKKLISRYFRPFQWLYKTFTSNSSFKDRRAIVFVLLILCVWLVSVIFVTSKHEYFRDEVRALSLMQDVNYPGDIYDLTQFDGHPPLWFFLLYVVWLLTDSQLVLPMLSILIATAAVIVFMFYGPFQLWLKCLFIFEAILRPDQTFDLFMPHWIPNLITIVLLYFLIFGLAGKPELAITAFLCQLMFGVFFRIFHPGGFRHQGLYLIFILMLYWILISSSKKGAWTTDSDYALSLSDLLSAAINIQDNHDQKVLILIGHHEFYNNAGGELKYPYQKFFSWSEQEVAAFSSSTTLIKDFNKAYGDENYRVYELK